MKKKTITRLLVDTQFFDLQDVRHLAKSVLESNC